MNRTAVKESLMKTFNIVAFTALILPTCLFGYDKISTKVKIHDEMERTVSQDCYSGWKYKIASNILKSCSTTDTAIIESSEKKTTGK
jgi:hypothetical protein